MHFIRFIPHRFTCISLNFRQDFVQAFVIVVRLSCLNKALDLTEFTPTRKRATVGTFVLVHSLQFHHLYISNVLIWYEIYFCRPRQGRIMIAHCSLTKLFLAVLKPRNVKSTQREQTSAKAAVTLTVTLK